MSGPARVLLIDDEVVMHRLVARALSGHQVVVKSDPEEALAMLAAGGRFDVILCDLNMGKMNGMQFHQALSGIDAGAADRMLFVTGGALNAASEVFISSMAGRVLQKPVGLSDLRAAVALLLAPPGANT